MHIEFLGHSIANCNKKGSYDLFTDIIRKKYNATSKHDGFGLCSEERILYLLKKTKGIDLVVIFHADPAFWFGPGFDCDFTTMSDREVEEYYSKNWSKFYEQARQDKLIDKDTDPFIRFGGEAAITAFKDYNKYFYTREVNQNRHNGALIQIDQFITAKNIPAIHCITSPTDIPVWFKFTSGIIDREIGNMQANHLRDKTGRFLKDSNNNDITNPYKCSYNISDNAITEEGNIIIADMLSKYIDQLRNI